MAPKSCYFFPAKYFAHEEGFGRGSLLRESTLLRRRAADETTTFRDRSDDEGRPDTAFEIALYFFEPGKMTLASDRLQDGVRQDGWRIAAPGTPSMRVGGKVSP
jgi:hypothetical protein